MNKKGFTLIELLAVIALLAIVGVFAGRAIFQRLSSARQDAAMSTYNTIYKEVQNRVVLAESDIACDSDTACTTNGYEFNANEYDLSIVNSDGIYTITLKLNNGKLDSSHITKCAQETRATCTEGQIVGTVGGTSN